MAEQVEIRLDGDPGSALRAIEEVKAALATLTDKTVQVRVAQDRAAASAKQMANAEDDVAKATKKATTETVKRREADLRAADVEQRILVQRQKAVKVTGDEAAQIIHANEARQRSILQRQAEFQTMQRVNAQRIKQDDLLRRSAARLASDRQRLDSIVADGAKRWAAIEDGRAAATERAERRILRARSGGGGGGGLFGGNQRVIKNLTGIDTGGAGLRLRTIGIAGGVAGVTGLIKPLTDVLGLVGAIPAAVGAAGIAFASFKAIGADAMMKAVKDQQKAQEKFKAGTISADAYSKAMKNALVGLSAEQKKALPFFQQWNAVIQDTSDKIRQKMLPALGNLAQGLKANRAEIVRAFGGGAGIIGGGLTQLGGFLSSSAGKRGISDLGASSRGMLAGLTSGGVSLFRSVLSIATAARPLVRALSNDFTRLTAQFAAWTSSFGGQQTLKQWFSDAEVSTGKFLHVLFQVGHAIQNIGGGIGTGFLDWLVKISDKFEQWTENQDNVDQLAASVKRMADTLLVVAGAVAAVAPTMATFANTLTKTFGPNTLGYLLLGRVAFKGLSGITKGIGGLLGTAGKLFGGAAAAEGGAAAGGGGALAGAGLSVGAVTAIGGALALLAAPIVYVLLKSKNVTKEWENISNAIKRAGAVAASVGAANAAQRTRLAQVADLRGQEPGAKLGVFDAKAQLAADRASLKGLTGAARERQKIVIDVDVQAVKDAEAELAKLKTKIKEARAETRLHADDSREAGRQVADAANGELQALQTSTDAMAKKNAAERKTAAGAAHAANEAKQFGKQMAETARQIGAADPKAANFARTAGRLATQIGRIPTTKEVKIAIEGAQQAQETLRETNRLAQSMTKTVTVRTSGGGGQGNSGKKGADNYAGGMITTPTAIVGEQAPMHPEYVIATNPQYRERNKGLVTQAAAALGGSVQFFQTGGVFGDPRGGWFAYQNRPTHSAASSGGGGGGGGGGPATPPGVAAALAASNGDSSQAGTNAAARYAGIPAQIKALKHHMVRLHHALAGDSKFLHHEDDILVGLRRKIRGTKDPGKKESMRRQIEDITHHIIPRRKGIQKTHKAGLKSDQKKIDDLTSELDNLVPGEEGFQQLVQILEGQMVTANSANRPDLAKALQKSEVADYRKRIAFLIAFTGAKSTQRNKSLFAASSAALSSDQGALDSILGSTSGGGGTDGGNGTDNADKDQALAMLAELADFARQGRLSDLIGADELKTTMEYITSAVGSFAKGSPFIAKSGLAMVHQGEAIIPASQNPNRPSGGGGTMTGVLKLEGSDALTRALAQALGPQVSVQMGRDARRLIREGVRS